MIKHFPVEQSKLIHVCMTSLKIWGQIRVWRRQTPLIIHSSSTELEFTTVMHKWTKFSSVSGEEFCVGRFLLRYWCHQVIPCNFINHYDHIYTETIQYLKQNEYAVFFLQRKIAAFLMHFLCQLKQSFIVFFNKGEWILDCTHLQNILQHLR